MISSLNISLITPTIKYVLMLTHRVYISSIVLDIANRVGQHFVISMVPLLHAYVCSESN